MKMLILLKKNKGFELFGPSWAATNEGRRPFELNPWVTKAYADLEGFIKCEKNRKICEKVTD